MKFAVLFVVAVSLVSVSAQDPHAEFKKIMDDCKQKYNCADNVVQIFKNHGQLSDDCLCALGCLGKATGSLNADNGVVKEKLEEMFRKGGRIPEDKIQSIVENCATEKEADECAAAKNLMSCIKTQLKPSA